MRERIILWVVLVYLNCALASVIRNNCDDCMRIHHCNSATRLASLKEYEAVGRILCGFETGYIPKVCCSKLPTTPIPTSAPSESIEGHPNLSLLPDSCGDILGDKIVGGRVARLNEYPWMALLSVQYKSGQQFQCSGSLINNRYVLTAAHCVANLTLAGVRLGEHDLDTVEDCQGDPPTRICGSGTQDRRIKQVIIHPRYEPDGHRNAVRNDIALLRLKKPVDIRPNARPICLPVTSAMQSRDVAGLNATVAGWGFTETGHTSSKLLAVDVPIHTQESCRVFYNRVSQVGENEMVNKVCAGGNGRDTCGHDSGGPLMVKGRYKGSTDIRFIQQGIVSYGTRRCGSAVPGVYTDISKYMSWILDNISP